MSTPFTFVPRNILGLLDCDKTRVTSLKLRQKEIDMKPFTLNAGYTGSHSALNRYEITDMLLGTKSYIRNTTNAFTVLYCSFSTSPYTRRSVLYHNLCLGVLQLRIQPMPRE
jgi:hypothetical protein